MKTRSARNVPVNNQIPRLAPATAMGIKTLQLMKTRLPILKLLIVLCSTLATTAVFGQTTYTWTNCAATDIGLAADWNPNGLPSGAPQDTAQWDGVCPGNLSLQYNTGFGNSGFGTSGINLVCTVNQVGNVSITTSAASSPAAGIFGITNNSATAVFHIGEPGAAHQLNLATRPGTAGTVHGFVNNSANAAIMDSSVTWVAGGGVACVMDFSGTGDWIVNHNLRQNNNNAGPITVVWEGPGTMTWSNGGTFNSGDAIGPIGINSGTVVLKGAGLAPNFALLGNNFITNTGTLKYDAAASSDNISRTILGTGTLQVNNGSLTLSGASTYTGTTLLSGGELIVNGAEIAGTSGPLGVGGVISFTGGTLGFSVNNVFDYSSRFSTAASQAFSIDTAGQNVTFTNATGLSSSGGTLTKVGSGTLTLAGTNSYTGLTTVSVGKLVFQGPKTGSGNITVLDSTAVGVTDTGTQVTPGTLTVGTSGGATLEFNNVNSTTTAPLAAATLSSAGTTTFNINNGTLAPSTSYPLLAWTSGSAPAVSLGTLNGFIGNLSTNGNMIQLNVTATAYKWTGSNNASWDLTTANNWIQNGGPVIFANGGPALLDDTAAGNTSITITGVLLPTSVTFNNVSSNYSIASSFGNEIGGSARLTKSGNGLVTLSGGANAYTGVTTLSGGTVSVGALANGGSASDIGAAGNNAANLVLDGGGLQYTGGGASIDRSFTLGTGGGTLDSSGSGALNLNNSGSLAYSGNGPRTLTLTGTDADANTLAAPLANNGGTTTLAKNGAGKWILTGNNTYSGVTTIAAGTLQIGAGGGSGSPGTGNITDNGVLDFNRTGTLTVSGTVSGSGSVINDGSGTVILPGNNSYSSGTTINAGTLQIGNAGATGQLNASSPITNNSLIIFNSTGASTISGVISGTGQLIKRGSGLLQILGVNTYTGTTTIDAGAQLQIWSGGSGANASSAITNNGTLIMMRQDNGVAIYAGNISGLGQVKEQVSNGNAGDSTLTGTNTYTGGTYILGGGIVLGDNGTTPFGGSIVGNIFLTNDYVHNTFGVPPNNYVPATITFNRADDFTFSGNIVGDGNLIQLGSGTLTLTGANTYTNGTTITAGTLQLGNGGTSGSAGTRNIVDNSVLVFNRSDNATFNNLISGSGSVVQYGSGTVTLNATNTYVGSTTVSNGTLVISGLGSPGTSSVGGDLNMFGGTLFSGSVGSVVTMNVAGNMAFATGTVVASINRSLSPSNSLFSVTGTITNTAGTLKLLNSGPQLVMIGDKFNIFNQGVTNGAAVTIVSPGFTVSNNLAVDGSVTVTAVQPVPTITSSASGGQLNLSWPASWTGGVHLQSQTNRVTVGLSNNWFTIPGTDAGNSYSTTMIKSNCVFYRLVVP
jgi:autotransporter-associated beta strand protein